MQRYLRDFLEIGRGSAMLLPDRDRRGVLYVGDVRSGYDYFYDPPAHPYECAHRVGVTWDRPAR